MTPASPLEQDLFTRLRYGLENFPNQQQMVCKFILDHYQEVAFMTVEELSQASAVSPATVVRTVARLQYESFHQLLQEIQDMLISTRTSLWWQMEKSWEDRESPEFASESRVLAEVARQNVDSIQKSLSPLLIENFEKACDLLKQTDKLSILGLRSSRGAALFCYSLFHQFLDNVSMPDHEGTEEMYSELLSLKPSDVLLAISVGGPHYAYRTLEAVQFANAQGVPTILITSDITCPAAPFADVVLNIAPTEGHYSLVPVLTVLDAIVVELGHHHREKAKQKLRTLEKLLVEKKITL